MEKSLDIDVTNLIATLVADDKTTRALHRALDALAEARPDYERAAMEEGLVPIEGGRWLIGDSDYSYDSAKTACREMALKPKDVPMSKCLIISRERAVELEAAGERILDFAKIGFPELGAHALWAQFDAEDA